MTTNTATEDQLIVRSARMALKAYGDLTESTTDEQITADEKALIITANERAWCQRVREAQDDQD